LYKLQILGLDLIKIAMTSIVLTFIAMVTGSRVTDVNQDATGGRDANDRAVSVIPSQQWNDRRSNTSSEGLSY